MGKDIISLTRFILDNNNHCAIKDDDLTVIHGQLQATLSGINNESEFIRIAIREFGISSNPDIVSKIVLTEDVKDLILDIWSEIERNENSHFIKEHGLDTYKYFYESYISAMKGEKENKNFNFSINKRTEYGYERIEIELQEKITGITSCAILSLDLNEPMTKPHNAVQITAGAVIKEKGSNAWRSNPFSIYIPTLELENYKLGNSLKKPYTDDDVVSHLLKNVRYSENKKILSAFELQNNLENKPSSGRKLKI